MADPVTYSIPGFSDPISSLTHLGGAVVFALLSIGLLRRVWGSTGRVVSLAVFAGASVLLLSASGVYHLLDLDGAARAVMQRLDHAAIFVMIAGTATPVYTTYFRGTERWASLLLIWMVAAAGITLKTIFFNDVPQGLGVALYLGFGWVGLYAGVLLGRCYGMRFIAPLAWGGAAYTAGAILELLHWPTPLPGVVGSHELFHLFVLAGLGCHWRFVWRCAAGGVPVSSRSAVNEVVHPCRERGLAAAGRSSESVRR